jgi:hypothetical protein
MRVLSPAKGKERREEGSEGRKEERNVGSRGYACILILFIVPFNRISKWYIYTVMNKL